MFCLMRWLSEKDERKVRGRENGVSEFSIKALTGGRVRYK